LLGVPQQARLEEGGDVSLGGVYMIGERNEVGKIACGDIPGQIS
jgi:hypothetical protein